MSIRARLASTYGTDARRRNDLLYFFLHSLISTGRIVAQSSWEIPAERRPGAANRDSIFNAGAARGTANQP